MQYRLKFAAYVNEQIFLQVSGIVNITALTSALVRAVVVGGYGMLSHGI